MAYVNIDMKFEEARNCTNELMSHVTNMKNTLDKLVEHVNNMTWTGANAEKFRNAISEIKSNWDSVYNKTLVNIPSTIEERIAEYQRYESNE